MRALSFSDDARSLTDGFNTAYAFEYRRIPSISLDSPPPVGFKVAECGVRCDLLVHHLICTTAADIAPILPPRPHPSDRREHARPWRLLALRAVRAHSCHRCFYRCRVSVWILVFI
jgi:hypothetical protein